MTMKQNETKHPGAEPIPQELVERAGAGDQAAFAELYERTSPMVYRTIRSMIRDEDLVWDVQQNAYLRAWRGLAELQTPGAFLPWLRRIAVNEAARALEKRVPLTFTELEAGEEEPEPEIPDLRVEGQPELALDRKETARLVRELLASLPEQQQLVLGMRYYEEMPVRDIAALLGVSPGTVKTQLSRGRKRIEAGVRALEKQGVKLCGLSPLPFLLALLGKLEPAEAAGEKALTAVLSKAPTAGSAAAGAAAGSGAAAAGTATADAVAATGAATVKLTAMTAGQAFLHGIGAKLLAGALAVAVLAGSCKLAYDALKKGDHPPVGPEQPSVTETGARAESELLPGADTSEDLPVDPNEPPVTTESPATTEVPATTEAPEPVELSYQDQLAEVYSRIASIDNRVQNISLAAEAIDGTVVMPGETFSFNTTVGERTEDKGYRNAPDMLTGTAETEIGGGVSQVASALYYAVLQADLKTVEREPHVYLVDYVPSGMDAAVEWGKTDFSFENTSPYPLKIEASVSDNTLRLALLGTEWKDYTVDLSSEILEMIPWEEVEQEVPDDGTYQDGDVICTPYTGYQIAAFRTRRDRETGGKLETTQLAVSSYSKRDKVVAKVVADSVSGQCGNMGDNLTWTFYPDTGLLSIQGSGLMKNYYCHESPWSSMREKIKTVSIGEGVNNVGDCAFQDCVGITKVELPESLMRIGQSAFMHCESLEEIILPEWLTTIDAWAFDYCYALRTVRLPASLSVCGYGYNPFDHCINLTSFSVDPNNSVFCTDEQGVLFNREMTELVCYPGGKLGAYEIPSGVEEICQYAFSDCGLLTNVRFPESLRFIGHCAFEYCSGLRSLTLPEGLTSTGDWAFYYCTELEEVHLPESITEFDGSSFAYCRALKEINLPQSVKSIDVSAFGGCSSLQEVQLPEGLETMTDYAFQGSGLTEIRLPKSLRVIQARVFQGCLNLRQVTLPEGLEQIYDGAFDNCAALTEIVFPETLTTITDEAFVECTSLRSAVIPAGVTYIGENAFAWCPELTIRGVPGSEAERYANENEIPFEAIS